MSPVTEPGSSSSRKRQRGEHEQGPYGSGAIVRIAAHNFMTYEHVTVEPGPRLNLILGPNGTGKSSLVCALCIGLAGNPRVLGRADSVRDFVRRGQTEGWVEITLANGYGANGLRTTRIKRLIKVDNSSKWYLNGSDATQTAIRDVVARFHVQLDNLCQFLPQDRVAAFAAMRPHELLEETEKAIGNAELHERHQRLKTMKQELTTKQSELRATAESVGTLQVENDRIERQVRRAEEREQLLQQATQVQKKIQWTEWNKSNTQLERLERDYAAIQQLLQARQQELAAAKAPLTRRQQGVTAMQDEFKEETNAMARQQSGHSSSSRLATKFFDKVGELEKELLNLHTLERRDIDHRIKVAEARLSVRSARAHVRRLPPMRPDWREEKHQADEEYTELLGKQRVLSSKYDEIHHDHERMDTKRKTLQGRIDDLADVRAQRLRQLEIQRPGMKAQCEWVHKYTGPEHGFKGPVLGPLALEVDVRDPMHAAMVEHIAPRHVWNMFLVEHPEDQTLLINKMHAGLGDRPTVTCMAAQDAAAPIEHAGGPAAQYAEWGITHTLDEVVNAPAIVKHTLCNEGNIHKAYVGTSETEGRMQELLSRAYSIGTVFTPAQRHTIRTSYYNNTTSVQSEALRQPPQFLQGDMAAVEAERAQLQSQLDECTEEINKLDRELARIRTQQDSLAKQVQQGKKKLDDLDKEDSGQRTRAKLAEKAVDVALGALTVVQQQPPPMASRPQLEARITQLREDAVQLVKRVAKALESDAKGLRKVMMLELALKEHRAQLQAREEGLEQLQCALNDLLRTKDTIEKQKRWELTRRSNYEGGQTITEEEIAAFASLPDSVDDLEKMFTELQGQAAGISTQAGILQQFQQRAQRIEELAAQQQAQQAALDTAEAELAELQQQWLPELQRVVSVISGSFSESFRRVGCAGEVALVEPEDGDMAKFAIEIRVKFREEEALHPLTASRQSGGERSLSTILYLIALQGVTAVPFRVVDEINQGMDAVNERKAFEQLVETATQADTPQCFLLTPKLLPNLEYSDDVTVLQIMNGPYVDEVANNFSMDMLFGTQTVEASA